MGRPFHHAPRAAFALALFAAIVPAGLASAAPKAAETAVMAEARRHFEVGLALLKEKNFSGALTEFRESYALGRRPSALRNMAQCQRELHEYAAAFGTLEQLLSAHGSELKPADRTAIARALEELRQLTAVVDVRVIPAGAEVFVDGVKRGTTPLERMRIDAGTRKLRIVKTGFDPLEKTLEAASMKETVVGGELIAEVATGRIAVRDLSGTPVTVFIDGKSVGAAPFEGDLPPGSHVVEGRGERVFAKPRVVEIARKARVEVTLDSVPMTGKVRIRATPSTATVSVDGRGGESAGAFEGDLSLGRHALVVEAPGYVRVERLVDVVAGESVVQDIVLAALPAAPAAPPAPAAPVHVDPVPSYEGFYTQFAVHYAHSLDPFAGAPCPKDANVYRCASGDPVGGAASLRLGYSLGLLGIEGVAAGEVDSRTDEREGVTLTNPADAQPNVRRAYLTMRSFFGGGLRLLTPGHVRFTMGVTPGYTMQSFSLRNTYATGGTFDTRTSGGNFALLLDMGLLFGPSPGTKVMLGVQALGDFVGSELTTTPGSFIDASKTKRNEPAYQVSSSTTWIVLPTFGFQFGH